MKAAAKSDSIKAEFRIWCESCSIRVAPNEQRIVVAGKIYHPNCYSKLGNKAPVKSIERD